MKTLAIFAASLFTATAFAAVNIDSITNGSGTPGNAFPENAVEVFNGLMHAPQYMPGYPTAATIWPRVVEVPCTKTAAGDLNCAGYKWTPNLGRGEYLFIKPKVVEDAPIAPVIVTPIPEHHDATPIPPAKKKPVKKKFFLVKPKKQCN